MLFSKKQHTNNYCSPSAGTLSKTPDIENFATASRSSCQQHSSSSSTVEFVDDTYTTIDESYLFSKVDQL